jgi:8-oxo-dGTP pyrophosphatase MutT (NUDIX family)
MRWVGTRRQFLLVQHLAGHWSFPKGHPDPRETPLDTARRELAEETGITALRLIPSPAFEEKYIFTKRSGKTVVKHVTFYLGQVRDPAVTPQPEEIAATAWLNYKSARNRLTFEEGKRLLDEVLTYLDPTPPPEENAVIT